MADEPNKENTADKTPQSEPAKEVPKEAQAAPVAKPEEAKAAPEVKPVEAKAETAQKKPRPANCEACNKSIKNKWYYRNGRFFCAKQCFKAEEKKKKAKAAKPEAAT